MRHIKKFRQATEELQKTIKEAKDKLLDTILSDNELSKVEKLRLIDENDLFGSDPYMCNVFPEYYKEFSEELRRKGLMCIIDDWFHKQEYQRHENVNLADVVEFIEEYDEDLITIMTNRGSDDILQISKYEFIDSIYDWCIKNKKIGFEIDW